ncbi:flavin monoamine oxidase family protein [Humisphaera borealis]|uniref:Tryptophan 2-monooxygenase n=1 Tax=Humisphaera borealis TaxID=2807512 RepID=A0A7M2WX54_9BACT|nr:NAD(P)/FAD-dependent oxidoreductase [Humisphaera borealis]QOV89401.1 FAD-dependent oxidoreductase [Humisphaera borealis]
MRTRTVGIIGGGPGGLMTAYALQKAANCPVRITLFEASDRVGGKILTPQFARASVHYEAGAAEFYDYSLFDDDPLKELIAEMGLSIRAMGGPATILNGQIVSNLDDVRSHLGPRAASALSAFDRLAKDRMTPQEFYHSDHPDGSASEAIEARFDTMLAAVAEPEARRYIEQLIHSDLATEPCLTSTSYGLQNYLMNDPAYMRIYGIEGGNEQLPRALASRIDATFCLGHKVVGVAGTDDGRLRVESDHNGLRRRDEFDFVVVALPHGHLRSIEFRGDRLAAAMQKHHAYYDHPAHYLRITALFERPFWRECFTDSYWMLDRFGGCCLYDESSREPAGTHGVLGWLLGGTAAEQMSRQTDEQLIAEAIDSLPSFLAHGRDYFIEARVHRWVGAVNAMPGGAAARSLDRRHQPEPTDHPNLFVVGDYMLDSTLNGVLDSAQYVAAWLATTMLENAETLHAER